MSRANDTITVACPLVHNDSDEWNFRLRGIMTGWRWPKFGAGGDDGAIVQSFWHGAPLSPYERLSIKSFLDCGHRYRLFAYRPDLIVPEGCEIADAAEILPEDRVFFYKRGAGAGSVAAFANLFRYKLLFERGGWRVDTDVVCQTRRLPAARYGFGTPGARIRAAAPVPARGRAGDRLAPRIALCVNATFVHLWNEMLRRAGIDKTAPPPEGSYLAGLFARHAVTFDG
jgi:hypothetical protein